METIELVGYLVFTMAAAGLMIGFLYSIDFAGVQDTLSGIITPKEDFSNLEKVNYIQLIQRMQSCNNLGTDSDANIECGNVLLTDELLEEPYLSAGLDKNFFEWTFNQINYCTDCNLDLVGSIMPNTVVKLTFNENNSEQIKIAGTFNVPSDLLPPVTSLSGCTSGTSSTQETITLSCIDPSPSYMGCKETKYKIDAGSFQTYTAPFNLTKLTSDHNYSIEYFSEDNNNKIETTKTFSCTILATMVPSADITPPVTSFTGNTIGWNTSSQTITLQCTDNVACKTNPIQYRYYATGTTPPAWSTGTFSTSFTITQPTSADTNYQIDYYSTDNATPANVESTKTNYVAIRAVIPADVLASCTVGVDGVKKSVIGGKDFNVFCTSEGLMWSTTEGGFNWTPAKNNCNNSTNAGFTDWSLPTYTELYGAANNYNKLSISSAWDVNYNRWPFGPSAYYWTSTPGGGGYNLYYGPTSCDESTCTGINTRCVRNTTVSQTCFSSGGSGTTLDPYKISSCFDLNCVRQNINSNYIITQNIDCTQSASWNDGNGFEPILAFNGIVDGGMYSISKLTINRPTTNNVGLIGTLNSTAQVKNLKLIDINYKGNTNTGGLCGTENGGSISRVSVSGIIKGTYSAAGGIAGTMSSGTIDQSYSDVNLEVLYYGGNFVGLATGGTVTNSYATGTLKNLGGNSFAGFAGRHMGTTITNSFSTTKFLQWVNAGFADTDSSNISNCFWDVNTSGVSFSYGGVGKTTTEMKTKSTFTSAGWNESIWTLCDGAYPSLVWEGKSCPVASPITVSSLVVGNQKVVTLSCPTCGSNKIEYRSDNSPWISYDNNFKLESAVDKTVNIYTRVLDSSNEIIVPETANSINVPASTQTDSTFTIVNPTGSAPAGITGGGVNVGVNAHLISRSGIEGLQFVSSLNSSNLSQMMPNSCEFTLDDGMLWISGETGMVGTTPVCLTKDYNQIFSELPDGVVIYFKFVVQARAKDLSGNYSKSGKALIVIGMGTPSSIDMCGIGKPGCSI